MLLLYYMSCHLREIKKEKKIMIGLHCAMYEVSRFCAALEIWAWVSFFSFSFSRPPNWKLLLFIWFSVSSFFPVSSRSICIISLNFCLILESDRYWSETVTFGFDRFNWEVENQRKRERGGREIWNVNCLKLTF